MTDTSQVYYVIFLYTDRHSALSYDITLLAAILTNPVPSYNIVLFHVHLTDIAQAYDTKMWHCNKYSPNVR